jgi:hypothetical protein
MTCPCPDEACTDVHAHDVTGVLAMEIDVTALFGGILDH